MPEPRSDPPPAVAVFDLDGTLTTGDCVFPFLRRAAGARLATALLRHPIALAAGLLGVDEVVCTRLERGADGLLTGRLDGANCRGPEKARRVRALLAERGLDAAELWAYGDSPDDEPLLQDADHGVRVGRTPILSDLDTGG